MIYFRFQLSSCFCADPKEALALAQRNQIDLLITDVLLEHFGDGISLARQSLSKHPGIPVLFVSGYVTDVKSEHPPFPNCVFPSKPFEKSDLIDAITKLTQDQIPSRGCATISRNPRRRPKLTVL